jgi:hypothetical protein
MVVSKEQKSIDESSRKIQDISMKLEVKEYV